MKIHLPDGAYIEQSPLEWALQSQINESLNKLLHKQITKEEAQKHWDFLNAVAELESNKN
ncbi:hypothetical protein [Niallia sp. 03190]|uniref:hypothetical protein n=1 Tax=Niallia sp. 03190 TaxID=3458061 RepID=UPI004044425D